MMSLSPREAAIVRTVVYASLFDYPLTLSQLHSSLIEHQISEIELMSTYRASAGLRRTVEYREGLFFPRGCGPLVGERRRREERSRAFIEDHALFLRLLCGMPYTRMVALSGSIAHFNLEERGDLDLFIVTSGRHVWSVTLATVLLAKLLGRRTTVCANFVIADSRLAFDQQDLFAANQVIALKPLAGAEVLNALLAANPFVKRWYPNFRPGPSNNRWLPAPWRAAKSAVEWLLELPARGFEALCRRAYGRYLRAKARHCASPEQVRLESDLLKLHTRSHRRHVMDRFSVAVDRAFSDALTLAWEDQRPRRAGRQH